MAVISSSYARLAENTRAIANASDAPSVGAAAAIRAAFRAADAVFASSAAQAGCLRGMARLRLESILSTWVIQSAPPITVKL